VPGVLAQQPLRVGRRRRLRRVLAYVVFGLALGALAGLVWWLVVDLPGYVVNDDGGAVTTERDLAHFIASDAWFTLLGAVVGVLLGLVGWFRLRSLGWPLAVLVVLTAVASSLVCWLVGYLLGPDSFSERLSVAPAGALVPIQLTLRTKASLLIWPFVAVVPVLLGSSLGRDDEEPTPVLPRPLLSRPRLRRLLSRWRTGRSGVGGAPTVPSAGDRRAHR